MPFSSIIPGLPGLRDVEGTPAGIDRLSAAAGVRPNDKDADADKGAVPEGYDLFQIAVLQAAAASLLAPKGPGPDVTNGGDLALPEAPPRLEQSSAGLFSVAYPPEKIANAISSPFAAAPSGGEGRLSLLARSLQENTLGSGALAAAPPLNQGLVSSASPSPSVSLDALSPALVPPAPAVPESRAQMSPILRTLLVEPPAVMAPAALAFNESVTATMGASAANQIGKPAARPSPFSAAPTTEGVSPLVWQTDRPPNVSKALGDLLLKAVSMTPGKPAAMRREGGAPNSGLPGGQSVVLPAASLEKSVQETGSAPASVAPDVEFLPNPGRGEELGAKRFFPAATIPTAASRPAFSADVSPGSLPAPFSSAVLTQPARPAIVADLETLPPAPANPTAPISPAAWTESASPEAAAGLVSPQPAPLDGAAVLASAPPASPSQEANDSGTLRNAVPYSGYALPTRMGFGFASGLISATGVKAYEVALAHSNRPAETSLPGASPAIPRPASKPTQTESGTPQTDSASAATEHSQTPTAKASAAPSSEANASEELQDAARPSVALMGGPKNEVRASGSPVAARPMLEPGAPQSDLKLASALPPTAIGGIDPAASRAVHVQGAVGSGPAPADRWSGAGPVSGDARASSVVAQVVEQVRRTLAVYPERNAAFFRLHPPELGTISVEVVMSPDHTARTLIQAQTPQGFEALSKNAPQLQAEFDRQGLPPAQVNLSLQGSSAQGSGYAAFQDRQAERAFRGLDDAGQSRANLRRRKASVPGEPAAVLASAPIAPAPRHLGSHISLTV